MTNTFKKMALPVAIASALFASGFASATPTVEATSKVGQELQTANAAQYQNIDLDARYKSEVDRKSVV